jgi:hypothetical protein
VIGIAVPAGSLNMNRVSHREQNSGSSSFAFAPTSDLASVVAIPNSLLVAWNLRALDRFSTADAAVVQAMRGCERAVYLGAASCCIPL